MYYEQDGKKVDKKTLKPYRGKQLNRYAFFNKGQAEAFLEKINEGWKKLPKTFGYVKGSSYLCAIINHFDSYGKLHFLVKSPSLVLRLKKNTLLVQGKYQWMGVRNRYHSYGLLQRQFKIPASVQISLLVRVVGLFQQRRGRFTQRSHRRKINAFVYMIPARGRNNTQKRFHRVYWFSGFPRSSNVAGNFLFLP